ncbi:MAG: hypothetical protein C0600_06895 [Ignavibacteria bacterium]|nr:MAG: hypothetical protein C0600_06895 [Ignavibacteria bacterium]
MEADWKVDDVFFILQVFCTFTLTGIIWFIQIVHYPLMRKVGKNRFLRYEQTHTILTGFIVAPLMLVEAAAVIFGVLYSTRWITDDSSELGGVLLLIIWMSTFFLQMPQHRKLSRAFDVRAYRRLLWTNWIRTYAWSFRSVILVFNMLRAFTS